MKRVLQLIILLTSLTCFSQPISPNIDMVGTWKYYAGYFEYKLTLNQDFTYKYQIVGDLNNRKSEGIWKIENNKLILNSFKQQTSETTIDSKYIESITGVSFSIKTETGEPVCMPHIRIRNSQTEIDTLVENQCEFFNFKDINNIQEFIISFIGLKDAKWIGKINKTYFEVIMAPEYDNYIYQINEIWKVKGQKLYSPTSKKVYKLFGKRGKTNYYFKEKN